MTITDTDARRWDGLASLRDGRWSHTAARRPITKRLDSHGEGITVEIPAPRVLAEVVDPLPGREPFRRGQAVVSRQQGSDAVGDDLDVLDLSEEARRLVETFATLADRPDAGRHYRDLRTCARIAPDVAQEHALAFLRCWRTTLDTAPRPPRERTTGGRTSAAERKRTSREQLRADEDASSAWWLEGYLTGWSEPEEAPTPGERVRAAVLYGLAREAIAEVVEQYEDDVRDPRPGSPGFFLSALERFEEWEELAHDEGLPMRPRVPGRSRFYGVADDRLGPRTRLDGHRVYTIPETGSEGGTMPGTKTGTNGDAFAEAVLDRVARLAWEERGAELDAYLSGLVEARDRHERGRGADGRFTAATGTDGEVVDLDSARKRR